MYECLDCGFVFEKPQHYVEHHSEYYYEEWKGCPICAGAYREVDEDEICGDCKREV